MQTANSNPTGRMRRKEVVTFLAGDACRYPVVREAAARMGWKLITEDASLKAKQNANVVWVDISIVNDFFLTIPPWACINHFPGMNNIARKTRLAQSLEVMKKKFPREYSFYPVTYCLPKDLSAFRSLFSTDGGKSKYTFILKPDGGAQGKGIFLTRHLADVERLNSPFVAQRYIRNPLLIDNKKFDLRIYVLVTSCSPLRMYIFRDGLVRLCTEDFVQPNADNINDRCIHLTNYSLNRHSDKFERDPESCGDSGSKRSISWLLSWLREEMGDLPVDQLWCKIGDISVKTVMSILPTLTREYREMFGDIGIDQSSGGDQASSAEDERIQGSRCFEILGIDVMIDAKLNPHLIEVNHLPSFATDSPLDEAIKSRVVQQALGIVKAQPSDRRIYEKKTKEKARGRLAASTSRSRLNESDTGTDRREGSELGAVPCESDDTLTSEKASALGPSLPPSAEATITEIYRKYAPERVDKVQKMMIKWRGYEDWLLLKVRQKYCSPAGGGGEGEGGQYDSDSGHVDGDAGGEDGTKSLDDRAEVEDSNVSFAKEEAILCDYERIYPPHQDRCFQAPPFREMEEFIIEEDLKKQRRLTVPLHRVRAGDEDGVETGTSSASALELSRADSWISGNVHLRRTSQPIKMLQPPTQKQIDAADRLSRGFHVDDASSSVTRLKPLFDLTTFSDAVAQSGDDSSQKWRLVNRVRQELEEARQRRKRNEERYVRRGQVDIAVKALDLGFDRPVASLGPLGANRYYVDLNSGKGLHGRHLY